MKPAALECTPFRVSSFHLTRASDSAPYDLVSSGQTTAGGLAEYGASQLGIPGGPLLGLFDRELVTSPRAFAQGLYRHTLFGLVLGRLA